MKAWSTGKIVKGFVPPIPEAQWSLKRELELTESDSEDEDYLEDGPGKEEADQEKQIEIEEESKEPLDLREKLHAQMEQLRAKVVTHNDERDHEDEEEEDKEEDGDDQSAQEDDEDSERSRRKAWVRIHAAMFRLMTNYRFLEQITSSSPNCYRVLDPQLGEMVLKICKLRSPESRPPKEIRCMVRCRSVPQVLPLVRWHSLDDRHYAFLTPVMADHGLSCVIGKPHKIRSYIQQLLTCLQGCHEQGVFHRDVKPGNCFWDDDQGRLTLTDFDCATMYPLRIRRDPIGTHGFMSPEMRSRRGYNWRADVYSVGVVLGMLLYGLDDENEISDDLVLTWYEKPRNKKARRRVERREEKQETKYEFQGTATARDLLRRLIAKDPAARPSFTEALQHAYFQER